MRADALFLNRSQLPGQTLLVDGNVRPQFNANQFDLPVQAGWQVDVTRRLNDDWGLEARYFNLGGQSAASPTISSNAGAGVSFATTSQGLFFPPLNSNLSYSSRLQDVELNACRSLNDRVSVLAGVRYLQLDDRILVSQLTTTGGFDDTQQLDGFSHMVGFQIGGDAVLLRRGRFSLDTSLKAGIYGDIAQNAFTYDSTALAVHGASGASAQQRSLLRRDRDHGDLRADPAAVAPRRLSTAVVGRRGAGLPAADRQSAAAAECRDYRSHRGRRVL